MNSVTPTSPAPTTEPSPPVAGGKPPSQGRGLPPARVLLQAFLIVTALCWLFPIFWAVLNSFRDYAYTSENGYVSASRAPGLLHPAAALRLRTHARLHEGLSRRVVSGSCRDGDMTH